jgi:hypothetical protein
MTTPDRKAPKISENGGNPTAPGTPAASIIQDDTRFQPEPPAVIGDVGQDDAFATESHPEGLRYGEKPHAPGSEPHGKKKEEGDHQEAPISIGGASQE